ncbi:hypothetical protein ACFQ07_31015 [Actinomadura adrarensis]|uniref:Uncharacterized protein n=1 Tax=Actinomadura adrarensis TaxID=1819600 RepID=A0ABW3CRS2_9ACTN
MDGAGPNSDFAARLVPNTQCDEGHGKQQQGQHDRPDPGWWDGSSQTTPAGDPAIAERHTSLLIR